MRSSSAEVDTLSFAPRLRQASSATRMFLLLGLLFLATPSLAQVATGEALPNCLFSLPLAELTSNNARSGVPEGALPSDPAAPEQPAESYECDPDSCQLPSCHCASTEPPGGLSPSDTPQFITWTSDDAMNIYTDAAVKGFLEERRNPNDCPVRSTYCKCLRNITFQ